MQPISRRKRPALVLVVAAICALGIAQDPSSAADHTSYILFSPGSDSVTMSGSSDDLRRARELRADREALLYVRQDGASYVIRDPATLRQARALFAPEEAIGVQQSELGARQSALGSRQAQLGAEQARLGSLQADATPREQGDLARQQSELARRQGELGEQQSQLGEQQSALGREQSRLAHIAEERLGALVADALHRGLAQRVH